MIEAVESITRLLSINEAASICNLSNQQIYRSIKRGDIPVIRIGNRNYINEEVFQNYLKGSPYSDKKDFAC